MKNSNKNQNRLIITIPLVLLTIVGTLYFNSNNATAKTIMKAKPIVTLSNMKLNSGVSDKIFNDPMIVERTGYGITYNITTDGAIKIIEPEFQTVKYNSLVSKTHPNSANNAKELIKYFFIKTSGRCYFSSYDSKTFGIGYNSNIKEKTPKVTIGFSDDSEYNINLRYLYTKGDTLTSKNYLVYKGLLQFINGKETGALIAKSVVGDYIEKMNGKKIIYGSFNNKIFNGIKCRSGQSGWEFFTLLTYKN